jgi:hypothetical protein
VVMGCLVVAAIFLGMVAVAAAGLALVAWPIMLCLGALGFQVGFATTYAAVVLAYVVVMFVKGLVKK